MGGWVPPGPQANSSGGTVYRGGALAGPQVHAESADGAATDGSPRRSWGLLVGLSAAAALSLAGFVVAGNVGPVDRVVGTMGDPAPPLPAPPVLPTVGGTPSGVADRPGKISGLVGAPVPTRPTPSVARSGTAPAGLPSAGAPVTATPTGPVPSVPVPVPTPTRSEAGPAEVTVSLSAGSTVSLESSARPGHLVRHDSSRAVVGRVGLGSSADERAAARFTVRPGLGDRRCVSFEADDHRGHFLRHWNFSVYVRRLERGRTSARDATFCPVPGVVADHVRLRSLNYPDRYLSVRGSLVYLDPAGSPEASTFVVRPPV